MGFLHHTFNGLFKEIEFERNILSAEKLDQVTLAATNPMRDDVSLDDTC